MKLLKTYSKFLVDLIYQLAYPDNANSYCNILTNKREITSDATGVTAPTTSGGFGQKEYTRHSSRCSFFPLSLIIIIFFFLFQVNRHLRHRVRAICSSIPITSQTEWTPSPDNYYHHCHSCYHYLKKRKKKESIVIS